MMMVMISVYSVCQDLLCSPASILDGSGLTDVAATVHAMIASSIQLRQSSV